MTISIFLLYFIIVIVLAYFGSRASSSAPSQDADGEYFVGGRRLGPIALAILVAAGACSTGTFVGGPGLSAMYGPGFILLFGMGQIPMTLFVLGILGKKINIVGRRTGAETYIDLFRYRYANWKPLIFLLVVAIMIVLIATAVAEFTGGSRVIQSMSGIPFSWSLLAFGGIITLYTALGGLKGVVTVAIFQGAMMTLAALILVVAYLTEQHGIVNIFLQLESIDPRLLTPNFGGEFSMLQMLGFWFTYSVGILGLPWAVQSVLGYRSSKTMRMAIIIGIVFVLFWTVFLVAWGGAAGRVFDPALAASDFAIPNLTLGLLPDALSGIVLAGIAGAGQSTIAALFILGSGSLVINVYKAYFNPSASGAHIRRLSIIVTAGVGIFTMLLALNPPNTLQVLITFSMGGAASALIVPLILGLYWPRANQYGAFAGVLGGLLGYVVLSQFDVPVLSEAPLLFAAPLSLILCLGVSLMTQKPERDVIAKFFASESSAEGPTLANDKR